MSHLSTSFSATPQFWKDISEPLQAAWLKISLVIFFGLLFTLAQKVANPNERDFTQKVFLGLLKILVAFYVFVVLINVVVLSQF